MDRRTLTMNWDGLVDDDDDDRFFESYERISCAVPFDLSSGSDDDDGDFEDSRMSFVSTISSASIRSVHPLGPVPKSSSILEGYGMWMSEPGDLKERRKRLLHGMGLTSNKELLKLASSKIARAITRKINAGNVVTSEVKALPVEEPKREESLPPVPVVLVRSRSEGDIEPRSAKTKQRKEELIGVETKQRLTRTSSGQLGLNLGICQYSNTARTSPRGLRDGALMPTSDMMQSALSDGAFGPFFMIKNLDKWKNLRSLLDIQPW